MHIRTFTGSGDFQEAIEEAEKSAQQLLDSIGSDELIMVQAQTIATETNFFHIITVTYE
jgi:hypothetical protein